MWGSCVGLVQVRQSKPICLNTIKSFVHSDLLFMDGALWRANCIEFSVVSHVILWSLCKVDLYIKIYLRLDVIRVFFQLSGILFGGKIVVELQ